MNVTLTRRQRDDADESPATLGPRVLTVGRLATRLRHWALWAGLGLVLLLLVMFAVRGITGSSATATASVEVAVSFPDEEAKALAVRFARALLTYSPDKVDEQGALLTSMLAGSVSAADVLGMQADSRRQRVIDATVARSKDLGGGLGRVTVQVDVISDGVTRTEFWAIPVSRDRAGRLSVADYPALVSPPVHADAAVSDQEPLPDAVSEPIEDLLRRFMEAYLSGKPVAPEFLVAGGDVAPLGVAYAFRELVSVAQAGRPTSEGRVVLATVRAGDPSTRTERTMRYRVLVDRLDGRWLVRKLQD